MRARSSSTWLRRIEADLGRVRNADAYAARPIDLDVLICGDEVVEDLGLVLPDPDLRSRSFLAAALLELAPDLVLPDSGERLAELVSAKADTTNRLCSEAAFTQGLRERFLA